MNIYECIFFSILVIIITGVGISIIKPYLEEKNKINKMSVENTKMQIFMQMDPKIALEEIVKLIDDYINEYVLHKFVIYKVEYIVKDDIEKMIKDLDAKIFTELSELYLFYIKIVINISTEDDLIVFLHKKISERVLRFTSEFNKVK